MFPVCIFTVRILYDKNALHYYIIAYNTCINQERSVYAMGKNIFIFVLFFIVGCQMEGEGITMPVIYSIDGIKLNDKTENAIFIIEKMASEVSVNTNGFIFTGDDFGYLCFASSEGKVVFVQKKSGTAYLTAFDYRVSILGLPCDSLPSFSRWTNTNKELTITNNGMYTIETAWIK